MVPILTANIDFLFRYIETMPLPELPLKCNNTLSYENESNDITVGT